MSDNKDKQQEKLDKRAEKLRDNLKRRKAIAKAKEQKKEK